MTQDEVLHLAIAEKWRVKDWLAHIDGLQAQIEERDDTIREMREENSSLQMRLDECRRNKNRLLAAVHSAR